MTHTHNTRSSWRTLRNIFVGSATLLSVLAFTPSAAVLAVGPGDGGGGGDEPSPYQPAKSGLTYALESRAGEWAANWRSEDDQTGKPWPKNTYNPAYVFPKSFKANFFNQCIDETDWNYYVNGIGFTDNIYEWKVAGKKVIGTDCYFTKLEFPGEGLFPVQLRVLEPNGTVLREKKSWAKVKDHLIVVIGDSAASGEGSPDVELNQATDEFGGWTDRRCHRSSNAAVARTAMTLEEADPHSTVTFLSFACSGATIGDVSEKGVGLLAPYDGIEGRGEAYPWLWLPSQVDQLHSALTNKKVNDFDTKFPARYVDRLYISGGINDVRFSTLATDCILFPECWNSDGLAGFMDSDPHPAAKDWFSDLADAVPGYFVQLKDALAGHGINYTTGLVMEYPDPFTDSNQQLCKSMMADVLNSGTILLVIIALTTILSPLLIVLSHNPEFWDIWPVLLGGVFDALEWDSEEIEWLSGTAMPRLASVVSQGAADAGFEYVGGIANMFKGHGYCANDNWIRRARESSETQGPWNFLSKDFDVSGGTVGLDLHVATKGLMHPAPSGYEAIATQLDIYQADLINHKPVPMNDLYNMYMNETLDTGPWGVLLNDTDADGDELAVLLRTPPQHGTVQMETNGSFKYTPTPGFEGTDEFTYAAIDNGEIQQQAKVVIWVYNPNPPPLEVNPDSWKWVLPAGSGTPVIQAGTSIALPVCLKCGEGLQYTPRIVGLPTIGRATMSYNTLTYFAPRVMPVRGFATFEVEIVKTSSTGPSLLGDTVVARFIVVIAIQPDRVTRPTIGPAPKGAKPPRPPKPRG